MQRGVLSVTALNEYVRKTLAYDPMLQGISLQGEISNFKAHSAGHWYFTLKDENSRISCVQFRQNNQMQKFFPKDGMNVLLKGSVALYSASGSYQFYVDSMQQLGSGELYERFLQLKESLSKEGLFDVSRKKSLPICPKCIGIISSRTGTVLHDIWTVKQRRYKGVSLLLRPTLVQGENAASDIVKAFEELQSIADVELIIVARGGGSLEDLWPFNEEKVVRAIANCRLPVVSSIGHETDFTLSDFAADVRAATPSVAAEISVPDANQLLNTIHNEKKQLNSLLKSILMNKKSKLEKVKFRLNSKMPLLEVEKLSKRNLLLKQKLDALVRNNILCKKNALKECILRLKESSPDRVLSKGYAMLMDGDNIIRSVKCLKPKMSVKLFDGSCDVSLIE